MFPSKAKFFESRTRAGWGLTFDDVKLLPGASNVASSDIAITSWFSEKVPLRVPIVSAAMDTVTMSEMAIAMAEEGGLGVIHSALSIEDQVKQIQKVKHEVHGKIEKPIVAHADETLAELLARCDHKHYRFRTFPVLNARNEFVGLLTKDIILTQDKTKKATKVMTPVTEAITATATTSMQKAYDLMSRHKIRTIPLLNKDGSLAGMYKHADVERTLYGSTYNLDNQGRLIVAAAVGTPNDVEDRVAELVRHNLDVLILDSAQGDSRYVTKALIKLRRLFPDLQIVVGNVSNPASAVSLARAGASGIKVGQGPGAICSTRRETGIGIPQVTAVYECVKALKTATFGHIPVCADGGLHHRGDIPVALAAGAHSVMMGRMLAGSREAAGEAKTVNNITYKRYRGMGSASAFRDNKSSRNRYDIADEDDAPLPEGVDAWVPLEGSLHEVMGNHVKALKRGMSYVGAPDITTLRTKVNFIQHSGAGATEARPHDLTYLSNN